MVAKKSGQFSEYALFAVQFNAKDMPFELDVFQRKQEQQYEQGKKTLTSNWREYIIGEVQDLLRNDYNFYSVTEKQYFG